MLPFFQISFIFGETTSSRFFRLTTSTQQLLLRDSYFYRTAVVFFFFPFLHFSENQFPHYLLFLESCIFRATTVSKGITFYISYLFRRATFLPLTFSEELLFHSYGSLPRSLLTYSLVIK